MTTPTPANTTATRLNRREAAEYIGTSFATLTCWASRRKGPIYYKTGKLVWYLKSDLDAFLESRRMAFEQVPQ
ncbi:helix-turn-helix domain-containing protein [Nitrosospira multiformis]|uniref:Helix-turn-helix domain-containing protein n=1 Tax=Nitrosospira multiformis TaxID=1231 RepID=A0A1I7IWC5_9PROT|nr:helix-turn-helix domain-containing protein [Nitrosospira multiformis]SFU77224.1 Helix-turn-helix domain-containing protein [Nitrosospira multiformis]